MKSKGNPAMYMALHGVLVALFLLSASVNAVKHFRWKSLKQWSWTRLLHVSVYLTTIPVAGANLFACYSGKLGLVMVLDGLMVLPITLVPCGIPFINNSRALRILRNGYLLWMCGLLIYNGLSKM